MTPNIAGEQILLPPSPADLEILWERTGVAKEKNLEMSWEVEGSGEMEILERQQGPKAQRHKKVNILKAENTFQVFS